MTEWNAKLPGGPLPIELLEWMAARGYETYNELAAYLSPDHYHPAPLTDIPQLETAAQRILQAIDDNDKILVWGDFDVDGQTSTAMLMECLQALGANAFFHIPDRIEDSHGVHRHVLQQLIDEHAPDFMIVCDTGSAENDALEYAKEVGLPVVISDHHEIADPPPPCFALVNPLRLPEGHALRTLSGAGITFLLLKVMAQLRGQPQLADRFLDLMALGLVADVVDLVADTRYWLQHGLRALRKTERPGILSICQQSYVNPEMITAEDIGFRIAPVLNSLGRLATATRGVELLMTRDSAKAQMLAAEALSLNRQRKMITEEMTSSALEMLEEDSSLLNWDAIVLSSPNWNSGIVGIVAARLTEQFGKPSVLLVENAEDGMVRGSIRSVPGFHVSHALDQIGDMLENYGGHELAGGLALTLENLPKLRRRISQAFVDTAVDVSEEHTAVAAELSLERLSLDFAYQIQRLGPFGQGNAAPLFCSRDLEIVSVAHLGNTKKHRRLTIQDKDGFRRRLFWWNSADQDLIDGRFDVVYAVSISYFKNVPDIQLTWQEWEQVAKAEVSPIEHVQVIDWRGRNPIDALSTLMDADIVIWADGYASAKSPGVPFSELSSAKNLVVYTMPPSSYELTRAIEIVEPEKVYLLAAPSPITSIKTFLKTLQGLLQTVQKKLRGRTNLQMLAERLNVTRDLVQIALRLFAAENRFAIEIGVRGAVTVSLSGQEPQVQVGMRDHLQRELETHWQEVEAYRRFLQRVDVGGGHAFLFSA